MDDYTNTKKRIINLINHYQNELDNYPKPIPENCEFNSIVNELVKGISLIVQGLEYSFKSLKIPEYSENPKFTKKDFELILNKEKLLINKLNEVDLEKYGIDSYPRIDSYKKVQ